MGGVPLLTKNDSVLIALGCIIGVLITLVILPALHPLPGETLPLIPQATPSVTENPVVVSGTVTAIEQMATREDVIAFIRAHTEGSAPPPEEPVQMQVVPGGTRMFSFDVDTKSFKPDEYIVTVDAIHEKATGTALFNVLKRPVSGPSLPSAYAFSQQTSSSDSYGGVYFIRINPIHDHYIGDKFAITGTTNLSSDEELLIQVYSSSFKPTQKSQSGEFSGVSGTVRISSQQPMPIVVPTIAPIHTNAPVPAPTAVSTAGPVANREFSTTNVQVKQVDEADIIKTDGENIYVVSGNCMHIIRAYPSQNAEVLSSYQFNGNPEALYSNDGKVVLIARDYGTRPYVECAPAACHGYNGYGQRTLVYIFSVRDPKNPVLIRQLDIDGYYSSSRMIGTRIYFVTSSGVQVPVEDLQLPAIRDDHGGTMTPPVYALNRTSREFAFSTIGSLDISAMEPVAGKTFLIGTAGTVYVSPSTLFIAVPDTSFSSGAAFTTIYSFAIDNGKITYLAGGKVDGLLLSQYSLDEYEGYLRVATSIDASVNRWSSLTSNKVTVLDKNLKTIGTLSGIAPNERIYAARFMGDRLYLVTFRETDPFFVIGLSDPARPKILGELKIPGYSSYLHPYDATHIIGIGKDSLSGPVKIALFDVADMNDPRLISSQSLGGEGSSSPVLSDPKAFLFDKERDILVLPLHLEGENRCNSIGYECYRTPAWGGVYVYSIRPKTGFVLKGKVTHYDGYSGDNAQVRRALYIEDTLYTMSDSKIVMSDLRNSLERLNEVKIR